MISLTNQQARRFLLAYQSLWPPASLEGKAGILAHIQRVGCIQFDPLNIVGQNPELVLQARLRGYRPQMLRELLYSERLLLDGFDKVMSIYGVEDFPSFARQRQVDRAYIERSADGLKAVLPLVRQAIEEKGPLCSLDLDFDQRVDWPWGPTRVARAALESLYFTGEFVVHHRVNTRKYYDLARRHIPARLLQAGDPNPTEAQYQEWHVLRRIGGVGLLWNRSGEAWLGLHGMKSPQRAQAIARLEADGRLTEVSVAGISVPLYLRSQELPLLEKTLAQAPPAPQASFIAPLDNLAWDRRLLQALFGFEYRWEVYTPSAARKYGYYVLPVLYGERFIGRLEPVLEKRSRHLLIKNWWWEPGVVPDAALLAALSDCFQRFAAFLDARSLQLDGERFEPNACDRLVEKLPGRNPAR